MRYKYPLGNAYELFNALAKNKGMDSTTTLNGKYNSFATREAEAAFLQAWDATSGSYGISCTAAIQRYKIIKRIQLIAKIKLFFGVL